MARRIILGMCGHPIVFPYGERKAKLCLPCPKIGANIQYVNDTQVTGTGGSGTEWGPA